MMLTLYRPRGQSIPVAPVAQVANLEFYLCLSPGFEPQEGRTRDFIYLQYIYIYIIVESALQRG